MELQDLEKSQDQPTQTSQTHIQDDLSYSRMEFQGEFDEHFTLTTIYYRRSKLKCILYIFLLICSGGLIFLFQRWFFPLKLALLYEKCSFYEMTHVLVHKTKNSIKIADLSIVPINRSLYPLPNSLTPYIFIYELCQFYIDGQTKQLFYLKNSFSHLTQEQISESPGLDQVNSIYGKNIMDIPIKPIPFLLLDEILTPFNIFQFAALALWAYDDYLAYSMLILFLTLIQISLALKDLRESLLKIRTMILFTTDVQVIRQGVQSMVSSAELVPGDLLLISNRSKLPCDCILVKGSCIMNEAILTGESIPINKTSLIKTQELFVHAGNENSFLYCGTNCLRSYCSNGELARAIVYQTGFQTMKGSLARSIMFSVTQTFSFQRDSLKYLFVLAGLGFIFAGIILYLGYLQNVPVGQAIVNALEILTIIIPPTLPTALGAGISLAINRLEHQNIQCIKPDKVNVASKVNIIGFDKTGTLTELGLEILGCRPIKAHGFDKQQKIADVSEDFVRCMATCHSLSMIDNELQGDPIDLNMFQETGWSYKENGVQRQNLILSVVRRFDFIAELQRMSVIVSDGKVYCKGSPEMIKSICVEVPPNYDTVLQRYTSKGYRVLACSQRIIEDLNTETGARNLFETEMEFLGFIIFENKLKPETTPTIEILKKANLKPIMVTGDNPFTAINIGMQCGILDSHCRIFLGLGVDQEIQWQEIEDKSGDLNIDRSCYSLDHVAGGSLKTDEILKLQCQFQLVINGTAFTQIANRFLEEDQAEIFKLLNHIYVFARMKPNHKGDLMTLLKQEKSNYLAFCGDGTNDTCALRSADIGLALSTEDASLAAPFTSSIFNISNMVNLIREGRASLVTSVECFKFMTLYSCIQSAMVLQCYFEESDLSTEQYLYQDLWLIIPLAFTMDLTKAFPSLATYRPISDLVSFPVLTSVIISVLICVSTQLGFLQILQDQSFYIEDETEYDEADANFVTSLFVIIANTQVLATAIAFTQGSPFRQEIYKNIYFMVAVVIGIIGHVLVIVFPEVSFFSMLNLEVPFPEYFRWEMIGYNIGVALIIIAFEKLVIHYLSKRYSIQESLGLL